VTSNGDASHLSTPSLYLAAGYPIVVSYIDKQLNVHVVRYGLASKTVPRASSVPTLVPFTCAPFVVQSSAPTVTNQQKQGKCAKKHQQCTSGQKNPCCKAKKFGCYGRQNGMSKCRKCARRSDLCTDTSQCCGAGRRSICKQGVCVQCHGGNRRCTKNKQCCSNKCRNKRCLAVKSKKARQLKKRKHHHHHHSPTMMPSMLSHGGGDLPTPVPFTCAPFITPTTDAPSSFPTQLPTGVQCVLQHQHCLPGQACCKAKHSCHGPKNGPSVCRRCARRKDACASSSECCGAGRRSKCQNGECVSCHGKGRHCSSSKQCCSKTCHQNRCL